MSVGRCPICGRATVYVLTDASNLRWGLRCVWCRSVGRNRFVAATLARMLGATSLHAVACRGLASDVYIAASRGYLLAALPVGTPRLATSEFVPGVELGATLGDGVSTCQDLEALTYADGSFDYVVTEDVLEHVRRPGAAFQEIRRVLRPGGRHIFTVPFDLANPTAQRVDTSGPEDVLLADEEWHGDSVRGKILAYRNWGYDLPAVVDAYGFTTKVMLPTYLNRHAGIYDAVVFVSDRAPQSVS